MYRWYLRTLVRAGQAKDSALHGIGYVKARLAERSTWLAFGAGVGVASALPSPWSYLSLAIGVVAAMVPNDSK